MLLLLKTYDFDDKFSLPEKNTTIESLFFLRDVTIPTAFIFLQNTTDPIFIFFISVIYAHENFILLIFATFGNNFKIIFLLFFVFFKIYLFFL